MSIKTLLPIICVLLHISIDSALAQTERDSSINFYLRLTNLESLEDVADALKRGSVHNLIRDTLDEFLKEHPAVIKEPITDTLGKEFKSIEVSIAKVDERGRWIRLHPPERKGAELEASLAITGISTSGRSSQAPHGLSAAVTMNLVMQPAINMEDVNMEDVIMAIRRKIIENLAKELPKFSRQYLKQRLESERADIDRGLQESEKERDSLAVQQDKLRTHQGLPVDKASEQLVEIDRQLLSSRLAATGLEARERAIEEHIARLEKDDLSESDKALLANLEKIYELRRENLKRLRALESAGTALVDQVQKAETEVLAAKIEFEKAKIAARGAERLAVLNVELTKVAIDKAEATARLAYLEKARKETAENIKQEQELAKISAQLVQKNNLVMHYSAQFERLKSAPEKIEPVEVATNKPDQPQGRGD